MQLGKEGVIQVKVRVVETASGARKRWFRVVLIGSDRTSAPQELARFLRRGDALAWAHEIAGRPEILARYQQVEIR